MTLVRPNDLIDLNPTHLSASLASDGMYFWRDIRGQERPKKVLEQAVERDRMHHAYLFTGLEGVGKRLTAMTFSAVINCKSRPEDEFREACGECSACRKIASGQHPDVMAIAPEDGSRTVKIDQIRDVQQAAAKQPHEARSRMVVIDEAHNMSEEAANALLKTLEEPATRMRLFVITDRPHQLLETIISRCQRLRFSALDLSEVRAALRERFEEALEEAGGNEEGDEGEGYDETTIDVAARYGGGSLGRSIHMLESGLLTSRRELVEKVLDGDPRRIAPILELAEDLGRNSDQLADQLDVLKLFFRDIMVASVSGSDTELINPDLSELVETYAGRLGTTGAADRLEAIREAQSDIDRNVNGQIVLESLLPDLTVAAG